MFRMGATALLAQAPPNPGNQTGSQLLSQPGPTFRVNVNAGTPNRPITLITYGDTRFTDPADVTNTNPRVRQFLVEQVAAEHPDAILLNGDLPLSGSVLSDYQEYVRESKPWADAHLRVFPALGNHEFMGNPRQALENWWNTFPELRNRRWYSAQLSARIYVLVLDSTESLLAGSDQMNWIEKQLFGLPASIRFLIVSLHHPPVADVQTRLFTDHNPRPNEFALRDLLARTPVKSRAHILVTAGHIHNYERAERDGIVYLVSGGGGATPYFVERTSEDQYRSVVFPNYHYVKLTVRPDRVRGEMYRVADPEAQSLTMEIRDRFEVPLKP